MIGREGPGKCEGCRGQFILLFRLRPTGVASQSPLYHIDIETTLRCVYQFITVACFGQIIQREIVQRESKTSAATNSTAQTVCPYKSAVLMVSGFLVFQFVPDLLLGMFNPSDSFLEIGRAALRTISWSFSNNE